MGLIDTLVILIIAFSALIAFSRGIVRELLGLTSWILAVLGAIFGIGLLRPIFTSFIKNQTLANIVGMASIALLILIICTIINANVAKKLRKSALSGLDRTLGLIFGIVRGMFLILIIYLSAALLLAKEEMTRYMQANWTMPIIRQGGLILEQAIPDDLFTIEDDITATEEDTEAKEEKKEKEVKKDKKENTSPYDDKQRNEMDALIMEQVQ